MLRGKKIFAVLLAVCLCIAFSMLSGCTAKEKPAPTEAETPEAKVDEEPEEPVELTLVTGLPAPNPWHDGFWVFQEILEETSNIRINVLGGPEVIPSYDLMDAVARGEVDLGLLPPIYTSDTVPLEYGLYVTAVYGTTPQQDRDMGIHDLRAAAYAEHNVYLVGKTGGGCAYHVWLKDPIDKADLTGRIVRGSPHYDEFLHLLGGELVVIASPEIYTAMERGVVDGFIWPGLGVYPMGWHEVANYMVQPGVWEASHHLIMSLDKWNALSTNQQQAITEAILKTEEQVYELYNRLVSEELEMVLEHVEVLELPPEEAQKIKDAGQQAAETVLLKNEPERGKEFIEIVEKYMKKQ